MTNWHITETEFDPEALHHKETVFTIGNGYLGTRGAFEEGYPDAWPATLVHGLFDDAPQVYTELANVPDWLPFVLFVNGERFRMDRGTQLSYQRDLDLRTGVLSRTVRWRSPAGHTVDLAIERFASLADPHLLCIRYRVTALDLEDKDKGRLGRSNFARPGFLRQACPERSRRAQDRLPDPGQKREFGNPLGATLDLEFRAGLNGHVYNAGLVHWRLVEQGNVGERGVYLHVRTRGSGIGLCEACHLAVSDGEDIAYANLDCECAPTVVARLTLRPGKQVVADKLVALVTGREEDDVRGAALSKLEEAIARGYDDLRAANDTAWEPEWEACNVTIEGDDAADLALRYRCNDLSRGNLWAGGISVSRRAETIARRVFFAGDRRSIEV